MIDPYAFDKKTVAWYKIFFFLKSLIIEKLNFSIK